jgi:RNA methyltransferase, TrmH family
VKRITSRQNAIVAAFRDAARGRAQEFLLLDGPHLIREALDAQLRFSQVLVASDARDRPEIAQLAARLEALHASLAEAAPAVMAAASPVRSSSPIVALATPPMLPDTVFRGAAPLVVIACDLQDPGNVGAIARVAEAAGAAGLIVAGQGANPFGWKALRGSMGSAFRLPILTRARIADALDDARHAGARLVATVPRDGVPLFDADLRGPCALLIGGEGVGLSDEALSGADLRVTIPMQAPVESLNAAVSAAVLLYEARRQRAPGATSATNSAGAVRRRAGRP